MLGLVTSVAVAAEPASQVLHYAQADYNANADGVTNDAGIINAALSELEGSGERLIFEPGTYYLTAAVYFKSGVDLEFQDGAIVHVAHGTHGFVLDGVDGSEMPRASDHATGWQIIKGLRIRHLGTNQTANCIRTPPDGDASHHWILKDFFCERTDSWVCRIAEGCHHFLIDGYTVVNLDEPTANIHIDDGLDLCWCHDFEVRNFDIRTRDDGISLKSYDPTYNGYIHDGVVCSAASGAIGWGNEIRGDLHDIVFENIRIEDSKVPIYLKDWGDEDYEGEAYDITFRNIEIVDSGVGRNQYPIHNHGGEQRYDLTHHILFEDISFQGPVGERVIRLKGCRDFTFRRLTAISEWDDDADYEVTVNARAFLFFEDTHGHVFEDCECTDIFDFGIDLQRSYGNSFDGITVNDSNHWMTAYVRLVGSATVSNVFANLINPDSIPKVTTGSGASSGNQTWPAGWP